MPRFDVTSLQIINERQKFYKEIPPTHLILADQNFGNWHLGSIYRMPDTWTTWNFVVISHAHRTMTLLNLGSNQSDCILNKASDIFFHKTERILEL